MGALHRECRLLQDRDVVTVDLPVGLAALWEVDGSRRAVLGWC